MIDRLIIKDVIKRYETSVNEVADRMGISRVTLSTHINGNPSTEILLRIAEAIGCDIVELFDSNSNDLTALIQHKQEFYKASTLEELKEVVKKIERK